MGAVQPEAQEFTLEDAVDSIIADHGGDPRNAVRVLLEANTELEGRLAVAISAVSYGFDRGWHHRKIQSEHTPG